MNDVPEDRLCVARLPYCKDPGTHDVVLIDDKGRPLPEQVPHRYCIAHANALARTLVQTYYHGVAHFRRRREGWRVRRGGLT